MKEKDLNAGEPKRIPYEKVASGLYCCFGGFERNCSDCPYDRFNDKSIGLGDDLLRCGERLAKDAEKWASYLGSFTHCAECSAWSRIGPEAGQVFDGKTCYCAVWGELTEAEEFCARGCKKDKRLA